MLFLLYQIYGQHKVIILHLPVSFKCQNLALALTPKLVIVGTAAGFSTAVPCFTQVTWVVVDSRTVLGTDNRPASKAPVMLHHLEDKSSITPFNLGQQRP